MLTEHDATTIEESVEEEVETSTAIISQEIISGNIAEHASGSLVLSQYLNISPWLFVDDQADGTDQSSTSVLATLAALAEATAPFSAASTSATTTAAEALNWLETHGITMISTGDGAGLEGGRILTLTEAGKLALSSVKSEGKMEDVIEEEAITETIVDNELHEVVQEDEDEDDETQASYNEGVAYPASVHGCVTSLSLFI